MGRLVPEVNDPAIRELILGNYRVIYRLRGDLVEILTVHRGARLLDPAKLY
ncbi:MAG: type II toxin-antitoxin system RelE/ParE family toxin [Sedimentisphaerales bacterium]|nr:type II toxin-antitoxin system RelE/ParE family toxin [Sedimentisphaerales bacterium]